MNAVMSDLHNHTVWSDGINTSKELIDNAVKHKIKSLGISDHYHYVDISKEKDIGKNISNYINEIAKEAANYQEIIQVYAGLEIDVFPFPQVFETLPYNSINQLDYVLLENLDYINPKIKLEDFELYIRKISSKVGVAHTDLYALAEKYKVDGGMDYVLKFLKRNNIFWELNTHSSRLNFDYFIYDTKDKMANDLLTQISQYSIEVSVGSDTHSIEDYEYGRIVQANTVLQDYTLLPVKLLKKGTFK